MIQAHLLLPSPIRSDSLSPVSQPLQLSTLPTGAAIRSESDRAAIRSSHQHQLIYAQ